MAEHASADPDPTDAVALTRALVRLPSVTPDEAGALALLGRLLEAEGFACTRVDRGGVANLLARIGGAGPAIGFAGHTDVVPVGDAAAWTRDPFGAEIDGEHLWGRGAVDMKSGVAAMVAAAVGIARSGGPAGGGALALLITGDEEGKAVDGTRALLDHLRATGARLDACVVGEPTSRDRLGDQVKIGRRGSLTLTIEAIGRQGHAAYPADALNPLPALARLLDRLASTPLDAGDAHFEASTLAITTIDVGNPASNVIPARGRAVVNVRFGPMHDAASLEARVRAEAEAVAAATGVAFTLGVRLSGEAFLTPPGRLSALAAAAITAECGAPPALSTSGGTSDARFVKDLCPVIEVGLVGRTMHQVDERVAVADIPRLASIYRRMAEAFFTSGG